MSQIRNEDVVRCWKRGNRGQNKNLTTDGINLYSYNLKIGYTENGKKIAIDHTAGGGSFYSSTTSRHVSYAKKFSDVIETPQ